MTDNSAAAFVTLVVIGMPMAYAIVNRYLSYQERLEMIRRGMTPPPDPRVLRRMGKYATVPPPDAYYGYVQMRGQRLLTGGIVVAMIGMALVVGLSFIDPGHPGPWLLGGLIPLFVGLAQIMLAMLQGATLRPQVGAPPQSVQTPYQPAQPPEPGPWAWRPGPATELERPVTPPDRTK